MAEPEGKPAILSVFEHFGYPLPARERDGWTKVNCSQHQDRNASATVSVELNRWKCHACDINEDSIDVIARERNVGFVDARRIAAEEFGGSSVEIFPVSRPGGRVHRKSLWHD